MKQNKDHRLELPGFGEWPGSSGASGPPKATGPRYSFLIRDKIGWEKDATDKIPVGNAEYGGKGL